MKKYIIGSLAALSILLPNLVGAQTTTCPPGSFDPLTGAPCPTSTTPPPSCGPGEVYDWRTGLPCAPKPPTQSTCTEITHNLSRGSTDRATGGDVTKLQKFLALNGYLTTESISGYFGVLTERGVIRFQTDVGISPASGIVGPVTRAYITAKTCGTNSTGESAVVTEGPQLTLVYDSANRESELVAKAVVKVTAGQNDLHIPTTGGVSLGVFDSTGKDANVPYEDSRLTPSPTLAIAQDPSYGGQYYILPAHSSVSFVVSKILKPSKMFAGTYNAQVRTVLNLGVNSYKEISVPANSSNKVTIVGEKSPYISAITSPVNVNGTVMVTGARFTTGDTVRIDASQSTVNSFAIETSDSKTFSFLPGKLSLPVGYHNLSISNPTTGLSNTVSFQLVDKVDSKAQVTVAENPTLKLVYDAQNKESDLQATFNISFTNGPTEVRVYMNAANVSATDQAGHQAGNLARVEPATALQNDGSNYIIPANTTVRFTATAHFSPKTMFAGAYTASLTNFLLDAGSQVLVPNSNQTNRVAIVGERAPYIASLTPDTVAPGGTLTIQVVRADSSSPIYIGSSYFTGLNPISTNTYSFRVPTSLLPGKYQFQIGNTEGRSNIVGLTVQGGTSGGVSVSNPTGTYSLIQNGTGSATAANVSFGFTVTNLGNTDIYLSKQSTTLFITSTDGSTGGSPTYYLSSPLTSTTLAGDTSTALVVQAGSSRTLTVPGVIDNIAGSDGVKVLKITQINYGNSASNPTGQGITSGLAGLVVSPLLHGNGTAALSATITSPTNNPTWILGSSQTVTWTTTGVGANEVVSIGLNRNGTIYLVAPQTPNDGSQTFTLNKDINGNQIPTGQFQLRLCRNVSDLPCAYTQVTVSGDAPQSQQAISVVAPSGTQTWYKNTSQRVYWTSTAIPSTAPVTISLITNATGDINLDGIVNDADKTLLSAAWGTKYSDSTFNKLADSNGDGVIDITDLGNMATNWQKSSVIVLTSTSNAGTVSVNVSSVPLGYAKVKVSTGGVEAMSSGVITVANPPSTTPQKTPDTRSPSLDQASAAFQAIDAIIHAISGR